MGGPLQPRPPAPSRSFSNPGHREASCFRGSPHSFLQKDASKNKKRWGSPNWAASEVPDIRPPPCAPQYPQHLVYPPTSFSMCWDHSILFQMLQPSLPIRVLDLGSSPRSLSGLPASWVTHHLPVWAAQLPSEPQEQHLIPSLLPLTLPPNSYCPKFDFTHCNQDSFISPGPSGPIPLPSSCGKHCCLPRGPPPPANRCGSHASAPICPRCSVPAVLSLLGLSPPQVTACSRLPCPDCEPQGLCLPFSTGAQVQAAEGSHRSQPRWLCAAPLPVPFPGPGWEAGGRGELRRRKAR